MEYPWSGDQISNHKTSMKSTDQLPQTQRKIKQQTIINQIVHQRSSHTLFLNLLRNVTILFIVMSILSIPMWVLNGIAFSRYKENQKLIQKNVNIVDYILLGTIYHTHHCINRDINQTDTQQFQQCQINKKNQDSMVEYASKTLQSLFNQNGTFNKQLLNQPSSYLYYSFYIDIGLQIVFLIGCGLIQYFSYRTKQQLKGNHIQDYTIQISGVKPQSPYHILPKIQQFLINQIKLQYEHDIQVFDITSANSQLLTAKKYLQSTINFKINQQGDINTEQLQQNIKDINFDSQSNDIIWVTFQSKYSKYLALRFLSMSPQSFKKQKLANQLVIVEKAPSPSQIIWKNIHITQYLTLLSKILSDIFCLGILLAFDLLILYVHKSPYALLASFLILILEMILKTVIIEICQYQKHKYVSLLNQSTSQKLTFFLYINTALIIFISCYDFGDNLFGNYFSTRQHKRFQLKWFQTIGLNVLLGFIIQLVYVNIRPGIQVVKNRIFNKLYPFYQKIKHRIQNIQFDPQKYKDSSIVLKAQLDICYAHIFSVIMFANTYSFTHPILYPLAAILTFFSYHSHKSYLAHYAEPASYNANNLNKNAIMYIYLSIIVHFNLQVVGYGFFQAFILQAIIIFILILKYALFGQLFKNMRKKRGPLCKSKYQQSYKSTVQLKNILTIEQLNQQILSYHDKLKKYTYIYDSLYKNQDYLQKYRLQQYFKKISKKIQILEQAKQQKIQNQQILKQILMLFLPKSPQKAETQNQINIQDDKQKEYEKKKKKSKSQIQQNRQIKGDIIYGFSQNYFNQ